jgi:hypothetical protein
MYPRSYPTHHRIFIKFHRSHVVNRVHNHAKNPVIISVYPFLSTVTAKAFQMLIWASPESPNMKIPRELANDHRTIARGSRAINDKKRSLSYTGMPVRVCRLHEI